jgi:hypothetical protein
MAATLINGLNVGEKSKTMHVASLNMRVWLLGETLLRGLQRVFIRIATVIGTPPTAIHDAR